MPGRRPGQTTAAQGRRITWFLASRQEAFLTGVGKFVGVDDAVFVGVHQAKPILGDT